MTQIFDFFQNSFPPELAAFIISMMPILELRGGMIFAAIVGIPFAKAFLICYIGNIVPFPFLLLFLRTFLNWLAKFKSTKKFVNMLFEKARKGGKKLGRYEIFGLFIFAAVPLPGFGGWTGALIAVILDFQIRRAFIALAIGTLVAGGIMSVLTYLIPGTFF